MKLIFATNNPEKVEEMKDILSGLKIEILSPKETRVVFDVAEDGKTLEENALKKAQFVAQKSREWAVADDTGLFIKELNNFPGIHSARWAGEKVPREKLARYILAKMKNIPQEKREAWFESAVALVASDGRNWMFKGKVEGSIALTPRGELRSRLPYDVIFIPQGHSRTFAEMSSKEKNSLSHRGLAFRSLKEFLATNSLK